MVVEYPVMMKQFCELVDISKNRLLRAIQEGRIEVGEWGVLHGQQVRLFSEADVVKAREYFDDNWGVVTISPKGECVQPDPRWKSLEDVVRVTGIRARTIIAKEKKHQLPAPKWLRKPSPRRVYGASDIARIVTIIKGEEAAMQVSLKLGLEESGITELPIDDLDDAQEIVFDK